MDSIQADTMNELITKVLAWAEDRNILEGSTPKDQFIKAMSEFGELADALAKNNKDEVMDAVGDHLVCLINMCGILQIDIAECLQQAYDQIKDRKGVMFNGVFVKESDPSYERIKNHLIGDK